MRRELRFAGLFVDHVGRPVVALPIDEVFRLFLGHAFPPDIAVVREGNVGEDRIFRAGEQGVRVRVHCRSRSDAEETVFRIDGAELSGRVRLNPRDIVADAGDFPAFVAERFRRNEHGEIRLAARRRERRRHVVFFALRRLDAENEHVFGEPALFAGEVGRDAEREAFFAEERVSAVAGTERPNRRFFREVDDVGVFRVARPADVFHARLERHTDGVHARHEEVVLFNVAEDFRRNARHNAHRDDDVGRVRDFDAVLRDRRAERPHRERNDIHRAAFHATVVEGAHFFFHDDRVFPVVRRSRVFFLFRADQRAFFDARDVAGVGAIKVAARTFFFVELDRHSVGDHFSEELVGFFLGTVAPLHLCGFAERHEFVDPVDEFLIGGRCVHI